MTAEKPHQSTRSGDRSEFRKEPIVPINMYEAVCGTLNPLKEQNGP